MSTSILAAINDSISSKAAIDFLIKLNLSATDIHITLLHVFRKPVSGEQLMGQKFMSEQPARYQHILEKTRNKLVEHGFKDSQINIQLIVDPYPTVADGIIDQFKKRHYDMVVIGRKRMSKAEEFVLGDPSVKLVRTLEGTAVLVVKCL